MNFLYLGPGSCMQYWRAGLEGRIPNHMCNVVQYYSMHTCGCNINPPNPKLEAEANRIKQLILKN